MILLSVIIFIFGVLGVIVGVVGLESDFTNMTHHLILWGSIFFGALGVFIFSKTESGEDVIFWYHETKNKIRFKKIIKKYQNPDHYKFPNRIDVKRIYSNPDILTVYNAFLCDEFNIDYSNKYYRLLEKECPIALIYKAYKSVINFDFNYKKDLELLVKLADEGNNYARSALFKIYYYGVSKDGEFIKLDKQLAMKYINAAIKNKSIYAVEQLILAYNTKDNWEEADNLIEKYNLKNTNIHYMTLGNAYNYGIGAEIDYKKAINNYQRTNLTMSNLLNLATAYEKTKNYSAALQIYKDLKSIDCEIAKIRYSKIIYSEYGKHRKGLKIISKLYKNGCRDLDVIFRLAYAYDCGLGVKKDIDKAIFFYNMCVDKYNDSISINNLAALYEKNNMKDDSAIFQLYEKASKQGDYYALCNVGYCYKDGIGVTKNIEKAIECYKKASENGEERGTFELANCYYNGIGYAKNVSKAVELLKTIPYYYLSHFLLGDIYYYDYKKYDTCIKYYLKYIEIVKRQNIISMEMDRYDSANFNIGYSYSMIKNYKEAIEYYKIAADYHNSLAANNLSIIYRNGLGVEKNDSTADYWANKAKQFEKK